MSREKKVEAEEVTEAKLFRTADMSVSKKLQIGKIRLVAITGGGLNQVKMHYFETTKDNALKALELANAKLEDKTAEQKQAQTEKDVTELENVKEIEKTVFEDTGLEDRIKNSPLKSEKKVLEKEEE